MRTLAVIMARAGSTGLRDKCILPLCGRPVIAYTIGHAQQSRRLTDILLTTDSARIAAAGQAAGIRILKRPPHLATDTARVVDVVVHAANEYERMIGGSVDAVVVLYGNIPLRGDDAIDRCIELLERTGCDSVRTVAPVGKMHPDWMHRLDGDRMVQYRPNSIHRRQELEPVYYHDGGVIAVRRACLAAAEGSDDPHAFFGTDRRAVIQNECDTVDIDGPADFFRAEALIRARSENLFIDSIAASQETADGSAGEAVRREGPGCGRRRPAFTAAVSHGSVYERR